MLQKEQVVRDNDLESYNTNQRKTEDLKDYNLKQKRLDTRNHVL